MQTILEYLRHLVAGAAPLTWQDIAEAWFVTMSVIGQHFNAAREKRGFIYWGAGNIVGLVMFVVLGRWAMVFLYGYFSIQCVRGYVVWDRLSMEVAHSSERAAVGPAKLAEVR